MKRFRYVKTIFWLLLMACHASSALADKAILGSADGVSPEYSGAWYNTGQSGHGISIEVISPERAIVYWYAYDSEGNPVWLFIDGQIDGGTIQGAAYYLEGMIWGEFDPDTKTMQDWGTVDIEFEDCMTASLEWDSVMPEYGSGQIPLHHLTTIQGLSCLDRELPGIYRGNVDSELRDATASGTAFISREGEFNFIPDESDSFLSYRNINALIHPDSNSGSSTFSATGVATEIPMGMLMSFVFEMEGIYGANEINANYVMPPEVIYVGDSGDLNLQKRTDLSYEPLVLSDLAGDWLIVQPSWSPEEARPVTISADGKFGFSNDACNQEVELTVPDPNMSLMEFKLTRSNCDAAYPYFVEEPFAGNAFHVAAGTLWPEERIYLVMWVESDFSNGLPLPEVYRLAR